MGFWPLVIAVLKDADIVLFVLDARMPEISRNSELEDYIERFRKAYIMVFTKSDLLSKDSLKALKRDNPDAFFVSGTKNQGISDLKRAMLIMGKRLGKENPKIGVVGYPNVGKSAIINALAKRAKTKISPVAGTTRHVQWVRAGSLYILDSPGVIPYDDKNLKLSLLGAKNPEDINLPEKVASQIISLFLKENPKKLEELYGLSLSELKGGERDSYSILEVIGKKRGFLKKGGVVDETRTAVTIMRDWQKGKLGFN